MPNIVTADELRAVLGVSESLYEDAYLDSVIDSAEETILPLLTQYQSAIAATRIYNNILYVTTIRPNFFVSGQDVVISGVSAGIDGTYTVTADEITPYRFTAAKTAADQILTPVIPAGKATLEGGSAAEIYGTVAPVHSAILVVSVEIFQSITAPGNQIMQDNFQPAPFILGRSLQNRVIGLLGPFIDVETMAQ
jgi:hypothetical protein